MRTPFFGPYSVSRSTNLADNNLVNLYPELVEGNSNSKDRGVLYIVPGLGLVINVGTGPIWGMHASGGTLFVVSGANLYTVSAGLAVSLVGNIGATGPVTITDNGFQIGFWVGGMTLPVYTLSSKTLAIVSLPFQSSGSAVELDGFVLAAQVGQPIMFQSGLLDMTMWDASVFASATANGEPIVTMAVMNTEIFVFKQTATEVWIDAGTSGFVFGRLSGVYIESGCAAQFAVSQIGDSLVFPSRNSQGNASILQLRGYNPKQISTHAIEIQLQSYGTLSDLVSYSYQQDGHYFYVLNSPSGNATWAYDSTTSEKGKEPMWHRRAAFSQGQFNRHPASTQVFFNNMNLVGDYQSGNLYRYVPGSALDNGAQRKWVRSWRALAKPSEDPVKFSSLRIDMQTGIGVPDGADPLVVLRYSDDGGHTWSRERYAHAGKPGETALRVRFTRLGSTRRNSGLDRVFELSSTDVFPAALIGAELN